MVADFYLIDFFPFRNPHCIYIIPHISLQDVAFCAGGISIRFQGWDPVPKCWIRACIQLMRIRRIVLRIRDPNFSIPDPNFSIPDPGSKRSRSQKRIKEFLSKKIVLSSRNMIRESKGNTGICAFIKKSGFIFFCLKVESKFSGT
jgi:hypothetical protein